MDSLRWLSEDLSAEFAGAVLGDPRRSRRLGAIASKIGTNPAASFPDLFESSAELEGFYRFLRNPAIDWREVLQPHIEATCRRAEEVGECLVLHDTTELSFTGRRLGMGHLAMQAKGFRAHVALLVATDAARTPLGVGAFDQYVRSELVGPCSARKRRLDERSEGHRWLRGAQAVERQSRGRFSCIHVADREADSFGFISGILEFDGRFVVRVAHDRRVFDDDDEIIKLHQVLCELEPRATYELGLSARGSQGLPESPHVARRERRAVVCVAATPVTLPAPLSYCNGQLRIELNLVRVWEPNPPTGEPPVEWELWTSEPIATVADIRRVVDLYRARWIIEEYFKALKTGCRFEARQLESFDTLSSALAIFAPAAWKLLVARSVSRSRPDCAPTSILSALQVRYLENRYKRPIANAKEALAAVARLGGHLTQNGEPGWQTLWRGYQKLAIGEAFHQTVLGKRCDQS